MAGKKIVKRIKDSLSLASKSSSPQPEPSNSIERQVPVSDSTGNAAGNENLAIFLEKELKEDYHKLVATSFAEFIKGDTGERNIDFDEHLHFLGYKQKVKAVELLLKRFPETKPVVFSQMGKNKTGRKKNSYMISFDEFEELLLNAQTAEGDLARRAVLAIKNAVFKYIKMEHHHDQQRLEEQMSKLSLKEQRVKELDEVLQTERSQRERMAAQRDADDEPRQTLYLYRSRQFIKIGETETDAKKRGKALQTGNPEELELLLESKCIDAKRIEGNLHHIFRWHKRRGEWYDVPAETAIYFARLIIGVLDGARKIDFQEVLAMEACRGLLRDLGLAAPDLQFKDSDLEMGEPAFEQDDRDPYVHYIENRLDITLSGNDRLLKRAVEEDCEGWFKRFRSTDCIFDKGDLEDALTEKHVIKKISTRILGHPGTPQGYVGVRFRQFDTPDEE